VIPCPSCQKATREALVCEACGADLRLPLLLDRIGRLSFNRALELLQRDERAEAENQLCAACALMPLRVEPHRALGKVRARGGRLTEAAAELRLALRIAPHDEDALRALREVERLARRERRLILAAPDILLILAAASVGLMWWLR
jgi:hypothetical protein